ncbi:MAG: hypothetical protein HY394_04300 [Candidatus Diapherotrites archaeon]|nr:hypothetical protein [Candidatus Diapherotrites archaeon]
MDWLSGISEPDVKKKAVFFGLEDTLVPGQVDKNVDLEEVKRILSNLSRLREKFPFFEFCLLSGRKTERAAATAKESGLDAFFPDGNIFGVSEQYLSEKNEIDRERYENAVAKNPDYKDEFSKQKSIETFLQLKGIGVNEAVLVDHDVWTGAFYTMRFSKVGFALVEEAYSFSDQSQNDRIPGLVYVHRNWDDVLSLILGKKGEADNTALQKFVDKTISEAILGDSFFSKIAKAAKATNAPGPPEP